MKIAKIAIFSINAYWLKVVFLSSLLFLSKINDSFYHKISLLAKKMTLFVQKVFKKRGAWPWKSVSVLTLQTPGLATCDGGLLTFLFGFLIFLFFFFVFVFGFLFGFLFLFFIWFFRFFFNNKRRRVLGHGSSKTQPRMP